MSHKARDWMKGEKIGKTKSNYLKARVLKKYWLWKLYLISMKFYAVKFTNQKKGENSGFFKTDFLIT